MSRQTYPRYKATGIEWLGEIPEHWQFRRLKHTADLINQKTDESEIDLPYTGLEHIESWTGKRVSQNGITLNEGQASLYRQGDVLFGKLRPYLAKVYAADSDGKCTNELLVLRPKMVQQKFLLNYLLNPNFVAIVDASTYGAKMPRANWDFIGDLPVLIPPASEQRAIAAFLDRETARIDTLIEKKQRQIELLQEKRSALVSHVVTKGLDPNAPMKDSGIEWLGEIPENWDIKPLKHLVRLSGGGTPTISEPSFWDGEIPWITPKDMTRFWLDTTKYMITRKGMENSAASMIEPGALIIVVRSGILKHTIPIGINTVPVTVNQDIRAMIPNNQIHAEFLSYLIYGFQRVFLSLWSKIGSTVDSIEIPDMKNTFFPVPPIDNQKAIISHLNQKTTSVDSLTLKIQNSIDALYEYRTALISAAVTGKIDVRKEVL